MNEIESKVQKIVYFSNDREFVIKEMYKYITGLLDKVVPERRNGNRTNAVQDMCDISYNYAIDDTEQNIAKLKDRNLAREIRETEVSDKYTIIVRSGNTLY